MAEEKEVWEPGKWRPGPVNKWHLVMLFGWYLFYHMTTCWWKLLTVLGYIPHFPTDRFPEGYGW